MYYYGKSIRGRINDVDIAVLPFSREDARWWTVTREHKTEAKNGCQVSRSEWPPRPPCRFRAALLVLIWAGSLKIPVSPSIPFSLHLPSFPPSFPPHAVPNTKKPIYEELPCQPLAW